MQLPHLRPFSDRPLYFLTVSIKDRRAVLANPTATAILKDIWTKSAELDGWWVGQFIVMPDHVHLFARPSLDGKPLAAWMKTWKSISSRRISEALAIPSPIWQRDYFDHFVRSAKSYSEKWTYVAENPVRKGLVA
ncbi:MAG TPA: transposase, partial [Opitutaceae bacterium]